MECPKFVGSSYAWHIKDHDETMDILNSSKEDIVNRDNNIIPKEITEKIIDTILLRKEDFKVFISLYKYTHKHTFNEEVYRYLNYHNNLNSFHLIKVYIVLQDIESINKSETRSYRQRFLLTVDMMYRKIAKALLETKIQGIKFLSSFNRICE